MADPVPDLRGQGEIFVVQGFQARNGKPAQMHPKEDHQEKGQPEMGNGKSDENHDGRHLVEERILPGCRVDSDGHGQKKNDQQRGDVQKDGDGEPLQDLVGHLSPVLGEGDAEVQDDQTAKPVRVLDMQGLIEPVKGSHPFLHLGRRLGIQVRGHVDGGARGQVNDSERDDGNPDKQRDHEEKTFDQIKSHGPFGKESFLLS